MALPTKVLDGIHEALVRHSDKTVGGRVFKVKMRSGSDIRRLRTERLKMTQSEFALQFGIPIRTLQNWEQGERDPEGPARAYLAVIERIPDLVLLALRAEQEDAIVED